jgi:hypothetical protein
MCFDGILLEGYGDSPSWLVLSVRQKMGKHTGRAGLLVKSQNVSRQSYAQ